MLIAVKNLEELNEIYNLIGNTSRYILTHYLLLFNPLYVNET